MCTPTLPRASVSVSAELQSMARMRAHTRDVSARDSVWQLRLEEHLSRAPLSLPPQLSPPPTPAPQLCASPVSPADSRVPIRKPRPRKAPGKIRRKRLTKEEEARFPAAQLEDLSGTTAARSRKMSHDERELMLHKRRLRNRESAARSRDKQRRTTAELAAEVDALVQRTRLLTEACERASASARVYEARANAFAASHAQLSAELSALRASTAQLPPPLPRAPSASRMGALGRPALSTDSFERMLGSAGDASLPAASRACLGRGATLPGVPSWSSLGAARCSSDRLPDLGVGSSLRKGASALALMDLELPKFDAPALSQDMAAMLPSSGPL